MNVDSSDIAGGTTGGGRGGVRRCLCHFIVEEKKTNYSNEEEDDEEILSGGGDSTLRCSTCVQHLLRSSLQRHKRALADHAAAKEDCARELSQIPRNRIPELQAESQRLRDKSTALRKKCSDMAVKVAQAVVENDTIREATTMESSPLERQRLDLQRLERGLLEGSLTQAIETATNQVRFLRFQWARKVFAMHRLQIDPEDIKLTPLQKRRQKSQPGQQLQRSARGIAKISGLPLPNAGMGLYELLPPRELQSALRLVATVTSTMARCLGIVLPHRILLTLNNSSSSVGDITDTISEEDLQRRNLGSHVRKANSSMNVQNNDHRHHSYFHSDQIIGDNNNGDDGYGATRSNTQAPTVGSSSTASLAYSLMGKSYSLIDKSYWTNKAKKALAKATGQHPTTTSSRSSNSSNNATTERSGTTTTIERSFDATIVAQRLNHATAAILTDADTSDTANNNNNCNSSKFSLSAKVVHQSDDFAIALQLLQNDVITLCIRAGVPVSKLWPAEAMLLNLSELDKFCQQQTSVEY